MARKPFPEDERVSRPRADSSHAAFDIEESGLDPIDTGVLDLEPEEEPSFLRVQKRVPVRRGSLPKKTLGRLKYGIAALLAALVLALSAGLLYQYGRTSWRFRLESSDAIQLAGNRNVTRDQVLELFGQDISRNVFLIPLDERKAQLQEIPWVESATVMRLLPNRLSVEIRERTPVAFVQTGSRVLLADAAGVLMDPPLESGQTYSFPVIVGMGKDEPLSKRAASLGIYQRLIQEMDSGGANYSRDFDEVDLADPEDVRVTVTDPQGQVLVHLGSSHFLDRYKLYMAHVQEWRQQFRKLESVDLRYDRQVIVNPDMKPEEAQQSLNSATVSESAVEPKPVPPRKVEAAAKPVGRKAQAKKPVSKKLAAKKPHRGAKSDN